MLKLVLRLLALEAEIKTDLLHKNILLAVSVDWREVDIDQVLLRHHVPDKIDFPAGSHLESQRLVGHRAASDVILSYTHI